MANGNENGAIKNADVAEDSKGIFSEFLEDPSVMPSTIAQQLFVVLPSAAGGIAGFILGARLADTPKVKTSRVLLTAGTLSALTFLSVYLIVGVDES